MSMIRGLIQPYPAITATVGGVLAKGDAVKFASIATGAQTRTVTSSAAGDGLSGGAISSSGFLANTDKGSSQNIFSGMQAKNSAGTTIVDMRGGYKQ